eukprot:COSAG02_NODE_1519_length_12168_cov_5.127682_12_plen_132_part_00
MLLFLLTALEVIVKRWEIDPDIAGATLMAAGGSAPELFTSFIGTFEQSAVGFGTIVGSAVFNVLFVIGTCAVASEVSPFCLSVHHPADHLARDPSVLACRAAGRSSPDVVAAGSRLLVLLLIPVGASTLLR